MIFIGSVYQQEQETKLLKLSKIGLANADNTLQYNIIDGIEENLKETLEIINVPNIGSYPKSYKKIRLKSSSWEHKPLAKDFQIGILNLPILKHIIIYIKLKKEINKRLENNKSNENIIIYSTYLPFMKLISQLHKKYKVTLIVTDLPELYINSGIGFIKKQLFKLNIKLIYKYMSRVNSFVILTNQMKEPLKIGKKPYVVVEGIVNAEEMVLMTEPKVDLPGRKIILYTGGLHYKYGVKNLLGAFKLIDAENYELWICGSGEAETEIIKLAAKDKRIKFYGYVGKQEVQNLQQKATILINPRTNDGEYNKYSFPSKTMEYMATGKPVVMYKLDGIPDEYDDYLHYINGKDSKDIADKIIEICEQNEEERENFGNKSRKFVIEEKNNIIQARKIIDMLEKMEKYNYD